MGARGLHAEQKVERGHRRRRIENWPQDARLRQRHVETGKDGPVRGRRRRIGQQAEPRIGGEKEDEITDVDHTARVVEGVLVNRQPRVSGGAEQVQHVAQGRVEGERDDVGARHHDVRDPHVMQRQNVLEDRAFLGRELRTRALVDRILNVVAD